MSYRIEFTRDAAKSLARIDKPERRRVQAAIDQLGENPRPAGVIPVKSMPGHLRYRVGDYRIIYQVQDRKLVVLVVEIGHRRDVYDR